MEATEQLDLQVETLTGDIRDSLLTHVRDMTVGWQIMNERDQRQKINALERAAETLVERVVNLVSGPDSPEISCEIGKVEIDKGLVIKTAAMSTVENITALAKHGKASAVLLLVDPKVFFGERAAAKTDADEPKMDLGGDEQEAA